MRLTFGIIFAAIVAFGIGGVLYLLYEAEEKATLTVAAGPRGSDSFTLMSEIAEVIRRHSDFLTLTVQASTNSSINISRLHTGNVDLATVEANTPAYRDIQLVAKLFSDAFILITHRDSAIYNVSDLEKQRVAIPEEGSSGSRSFWSVIDHYSVPPQGFRSLSMTRDKAMEHFLTKQADALFLVSSLRDPTLLAFLEEARQRSIALRFVPIEQAGAMALKRPFLEPTTILRGAFDGSGPSPLRDIITAGVDRLLVANAQANERAIRELLRVVFENRLDLLIRMPLSSSIEGPDEGSGASLPYHAGAQSYYDRDKPAFIQENAEPLALGVAVLAMLASVLLALKRSLSNRAKNRADVYNVELLAISRRVRPSQDIIDLVQLENELADILETAVDALDNDRVTEEGFQSFSFLWTAVRDQILDRRGQLHTSAKSINPEPN